MEKSVKYGDYQITKADNGSISVLKNGDPQSNAKAALREVADLIGLKPEEGWNTQQFGAKLIKAIDQRLENGIDEEEFLKHFAPAETQEKKLAPSMRLVQLALRTCVSPEDGFQADLFDLDELMDIAVHFGFERDDIIDAYNEIMESGELLAMDEIVEGVNVGLADAIIATCCGFCLTSDEVYKYRIATIHGFCKECGLEGHSVTLWLIEFLKKNYEDTASMPKFETIDF